MVTEVKVGESTLHVFVDVARGSFHVINFETHERATQRYDSRVAIQMVYPTI